MLLLLLLPLAGEGQMLFIEEVNISGNKTTREYIVKRELDIQPGDSISMLDIPDRFDRNRDNLLNLGLFNDVTINIYAWDVPARRISISVEVTEAWYLYILPILELADRNFNVWWEEFNASLSRVNIGLQVEHLNFSGHRDRIKFKGQLGFTPKLDLTYQIPFFNRKRTLGFKINAFHSVNKEINYITEDNRLIFLRNDDESVIFRRNRLSASLSYRPSYFLTQELIFEFHDRSVGSAIAGDANPDFFLDGRRRQRFFLLTYLIKYDNRDFRIYPSSGIAAGIELRKSGLGIFGDLNLIEVFPSFEVNKRLNKSLNIGTSISGKLSLNRARPPYYNYRGLGYGDDYIRGYELYVTDGLDYFLSKTSLRFEILNTTIRFGKAMPIKAFRVMPFRIYMAGNFDFAYVNDPYYFRNNTFNNRWLYGYGPSLAFVLYNNFAILVEYSWNHVNEKGLFLHHNFSF